MHVGRFVISEKLRVEIPHTLHYHLYHRDEQNDYYDYCDYFDDHVYRCEEEGDLISGGNDDFDDNDDKDDDDGDNDDNDDNENAFNDIDCPTHPGILANNLFMISNSLNEERLRDLVSELLTKGNKKTKT